MLSDDLRYWLALNRLGFINFSRLQQLQLFFPELKLIFSATEKDLQQAANLSAKQIAAIKQFDFAEVEKDLKWLMQSNQHHILTLVDTDYPELLKTITQPPILLYVDGQLSALSLPQFAIVGSRKPTPIAKENAYYFAKNMAQYGFSIASGLALGIDAASHQGALQTGTTIAVMGTSIEKIYPRQCQQLAMEIKQRGALLSEFPIGTPPRPQNFPQRNRIISGLSVGVLVIEAALQSGSLITAKYAAEQNREVFAIPGSIHNPQSKGCHWLIKQGAVLTEKTEDIINELQGVLEWLKLQSVQEKLDFSDIDEDDSAILACLSEEPVALDQIVAQSGYSIEKVATHLISLELRNLIKSMDGGYAKIVISS